MAILAQEILADNPRRFYRLTEKGAAIIADLGSDKVNIIATGSPVYNQSGGIPSRPGDTSIFYDGVDDAHIGPGTGVASDAGGGSPKAWAIMVVVKIDSSQIINDWIFSEGSSLSTNPLFGFALANATGQVQGVMRSADSGNTALNSPGGTDIRDSWKLLHFECDPTDSTTGVRLYIDGSQVATGTPASRAAYGATPTIFDRICVGGLYRASLGNFGPGNYQYGAIFDHALGQTRVTAHWNAFNDTPAGANGSTIKPLKKSL